MSRQGNLVIIGVFVIGAILLMVGGVVALSTGLFFKETETRTMYFQGSVAGLQVGAPVTFRGVKIGEVSDIQVHLNTQDLSLLIPVIVELEPKRVHAMNSRAPSGAVLEQMVERGLRARLDLQSIVTGLLYVNLDFYPNTASRFLGEDHSIEIPTLPSPFERLRSLIDQLPLNEIADDVSGILKSVRGIVDDPETKLAVHDLRLTIADARTLIGQLNEQVKPLRQDLSATAAGAQNTFKELDATLRRVSASLESIDRAVGKVDRTLSSDSPIQYRLTKTLKDIGDASTAVKDLSTYLQRNPQSVIRGNR